MTNIHTEMDCDKLNLMFEWFKMRGISEERESYYFDLDNGIVYKLDFDSAILAKSYL